ncbi:hypothetical protein CAC42_4633 [Sphaceloma murrayae]|uniref:Small ribosomal subunit protein mS38 n=1 Tax=Sphaceloma murrayae TaxID=2082308 RepID=A0A2K1QNZ4_9PEZI|nr:hypothetical protein CAC42_4633 [Sphaceloma murrayae]
MPIANNENAKSNSWFDSLPSVPSTNAMSERDLKLSSLFALHRPLALDMPLPPVTPQYAFEKLFEPSTSHKAQPADVVATLQSTISALESSAQSQSSDLRWSVVQESPSNSANGGVRHLDGQPRRPVNVEDFVKQLHPYMKPPAPVPVPQLSASQQKARKARDLKRRQESNQDYRATIVLRQVDGQDYMTGELESMEPIIGQRMSNVARKMRGESSSTARHPPQTQTPNQARRAIMSFGKRVKMRKVMMILGQRYQPRYVSVAPRGPYARRRAAAAATDGVEGSSMVAVGEVQNQPQGIMEAISVKRQRKLKMKKHKYKKLMKRTRNLRRRLDK